VEEYTRLRNLKAYNNLDELITDCDLIHVCTPPVTHEPIVITALQKAKNVIIEKPFTGYFGDGSDEFNGDYFSREKGFEHTNASIKRMLDAEKKSEGSIMYAEYWVYAPAIQKEREILEKTGETLTIHFKGKAIGAYDVMGPDAGRIVVEIDGIVKDTISRFDEYCTYRRMNYFVIDNLENKDHTVVFRVFSDPFDKEVILSKRGEIMKNPLDFKENYWYVGKILIDGEISSK